MSLYAQLVPFFMILMLGTLYLHSQYLLRCAWRREERLQELLEQFMKARS